MVAEVVNRQGRHAVDTALVAAAADAALASEGADDLEVSVTVVDDAAIHELNRIHLGHDDSTDVISFPLRSPGDPDPLLGDVVVSADRAAVEAAERAIPFEEELLRYVVHGCLHLLGYDDSEPEAAERMFSRQEEILRAVLQG